ncbi:MAG: CPBP family intramembrane metalloprotease [Prolixibacteraceae bacterium]|nr:CPBP family intramembrane metalloprotease [Prolixibacteraceae bacterium]
MKEIYIITVESATTKYYPTFWQAVNLIVLYTFLQTLIDFPLALYDYQYGTDWLREPLLKIPIFFATTFVILFLGTRFSGLPYRDIFPLKSFHWLNIPVLLISLVALQFFMNEISIHVDKMLPPPGWFMELFAKIFESDIGIWGGILRVVVLAPIVEELIFRGVIFSGFQRIYPAFWAIFFSALLFSLFHLNPWQLGPTFLLGLLLGFVRLRTGSLLAAIFTHALHNAMIFFSVYYHEAYTIPGFLQPGLSQNYVVNLILLTLGIGLIWYFSRPKKVK